MSRAEDLLNAVSEEIPVHAHPVPDTDTYFIIDPITRKIENTNRKKTVIMQYDHNSERFTFELPRYIDGHDMLECTSVTVNVDNIEAVETDESEDGEVVEPRINSDAPDVTDLRVHPNDPEKVITSWLISRNSTQLSGILSFSIEFKCVDSNGDVVYEWSTDNFDEIEVKARKKNGEAAVMPYTDVLEQWRTDIFGAGDSVMANIAAEGEAQVAAVKMESETQQEAVELKGAQTLETIPDDYTEVDAMAEEAVRTKADAIVCEAAGESIVLKDSSNDHIRGLKLFGKSTQKTTTGAQLFDIHDTLVVRYCTVVDDTVEIDYDNTEGTTTAYANFYTNLSDEISESTDYLVVLEVMSASGVNRIRAVSLQDDVYKGQFAASYAVESPSVGTYVKVVKTVESFDGCASMCRGFAEILPGSVGKAKFRISVLADTSVTADTFKYEPYTGGKPSPNPEYPQEIVSIENPTASSYGKNLLNCSDISLTDFANHYYTICTDFSPMIGETYALSMNVNTDVLPFAINIGCGSTKYDADMSPKISASYTENGRIVISFKWSPTQEQIECGYTKLFIRVPRYASKTTFNATVTNIQLELGDVVTDYEPYKPVQSVAIPHTLPGIPVTSGGNYTDPDGQQWICDEIDLERGVYVRRIGQTMISSAQGIHSSGVNLPAAYPIFDVAPIEHTLLCDKLIGVSTHPNKMNNGEITLVSNSGACYFAIDGCTTVDEYTTYLNGSPLTVQYILKTPIETPLTAEEITTFKALRTNYPNTTILNDAGAWMSVKYNADTKSYIENPKTLKLVDSSTGVVYELKIVDGAITVNPV